MRKTAIPTDRHAGRLYEMTQALTAESNGNFEKSDKGWQREEGARGSERNHETQERGIGEISMSSRRLGDQQF